MARRVFINDVDVSGEVDMKHSIISGINGEGTYLRISGTSLGLQDEDKITMKEIKNGTTTVLFEGVFTAMRQATNSIKMIRFYTNRIAMVSFFETALKKEKNDRLKETIAEKAIDAITREVDSNREPNIKVAPDLFKSNFFKK